MVSRSNIQEVTATVATLMGFPAPVGATPANPVLVEKARSISGEDAPFEKALLYNPDAIALWLYASYPHLLSSMVRDTCVQLSVGSVMPTVTPVCFASMYTGVAPSVHGICKYEKPALSIDTLFDAALRAGKRCAIVSETDQSISCLFLGRDMDYYFYDTPEEVNQKAQALIREDRHDIVVVYNGDYDTTMHRWGPTSDAALAVLEQNSRAFSQLVETARTAWRSYHTLYAFLPDHGCHAIDGGLGSHGLDMDEDIHVIHGWGFWKKSL